MIVGISGKKQSGKNTVALIWQYLYDYYNNNYKHPITVKDFKEYVKNNHHLKSVWIQKSFAYKIKQVTCILLGCTMEQLEDPKFKESTLGEEWVKYELSYTSHDRLSYCNCSNYYEKYFRSKEEAIEYIEGNLEVDQDSIEISKIELTPRLLLQLLGTECEREIIHPDIWVKALMSEYKPIEATLINKDCPRQDIYSLTEEDGIIYRTIGELYPNWIISDVRFPNEARAIKDRNGILIRVERFCYDSAEDFLVCNPNSELRKIGIQDYNINKTLSLEEITNIAKAHGYVPFFKQHESETALDNYENWDYVIDNNYSLAELILTVRQIMFKEGIIYE